MYSKVIKVIKVHFFFIFLIYFNKNITYIFLYFYTVTLCLMFNVTHQCHKSTMSLFIKTKANKAHSDSDSDSERALKVVMKALKSLERRSDLHPELPGARDGRAAHLHEEEVLRVAAAPHVHQLQHHGRRVRVQLHKVHRLVRQAQPVDAHQVLGLPEALRPHLHLPHLLEGGARVGHGGGRGGGPSPVVPAPCTCNGDEVAVVVVRRALACGEGERGRERDRETERQRERERERRREKKIKISYLRTFSIMSCLPARIKTELNRTQMKCGNGF